MVRCASVSGNVAGLERKGSCDGLERRGSCDGLERRGICDVQEMRGSGFEPGRTVVTLLG